MSSFSPGDVVRLKSGSPNMTVEQQAETEILGETRVWCLWFDGAKQHSETFPPAALELVGPKSTPTVNLGHSASKRS